MSEWEDWNRVANGAKVRVQAFKATPWYRRVYGAFKSTPLFHRVGAAIVALLVVSVLVASCVG